MTLKIDVNRDVTKSLGKLIDRSLRDNRLFNFVSESFLTYEEFDKWNVPKDDVHLKQGPGTGSGYVHLTENMEEPELRHAKHILKADEVANAIIYSPMSGMFWHTNSNNPGTRIYYTFAIDKSVFRYKDPLTGEIHEEQDSVGWTARAFKIPDPQDGRFWHAVWTAGRRFSFGFNVLPDVL